MSTSRKKQKPQLRIRWMNEVDVKPVQWAWHNRIVKDSLNLVLGKEGIGKGTLMAYLLSRWTGGKLEGSMFNQPCNVAIIGNEDSYERVWTPRVLAAGGNISRVADLAWEDFKQIDVHRDIDALSSVVQERDIKVLYFDAFLDNLSGEVSASDPKQVGDALAPLRVLSDELGVTSIATLHPNKRGTSFRELQQMSAKFTGVSRSSLLLAEHPDDVDYRVLALGKSNYASVHDVESRQFRIVSERMRVGKQTITTSRVGGLEYSPFSVEELIEKSMKSDRYKKDSKAEAIRVLIKQALKDKQWHLAQDVYDLCEEHGFEVKRSIRRAKEDLSVEARRVDEYQGGWEWKLP